MFLTRSYNDLDCRIPLLLEFSKDKKFRSVSIIGIPSNIGINNPKKHELSNFLLQKNIQITTLYDYASNASLAKIMYLFYNLIDRKQYSGAKIISKMKKLIFKIIVWSSIRDKKWIERIIQSFQSSIIITDEIAFQKGRSFFVDELIKNSKSQDYSIYSFLTGHNPYLNLWHDKKVDYLFKSDEKVGVPYFVPSENDKNVMKKELPRESIEVVGNTRFDSSWIKTLSQMAEKKIENDHLLKRNCGKRIVFMLSKIEYGVDLENIIETINVCANIENSCVIVKPHTRGMTLDTLKNQLDNKVHSGVKYSSNELIQWADTVLFTGSSIIFQAMQLRKQVIFLKFCQRYETIFDNGSAVHVVENVVDTVNTVISKNKAELSHDKINVFLIKTVYNNISSGLVCRSIKTKIESMEQNKT